MYLEPYFCSDNSRPVADRLISEQYPLEDEEMEIEEGVNVTEQVVALLDQMIRQGKELRFWESDTTEEKCTEDEFVGYGKQNHHNCISSHIHPIARVFFQEHFEKYLTWESIINHRW